MNEAQSQSQAGRGASEGEWRPLIGRCFLSLVLGVMFISAGCKSERYEGIAPVTPRKGCFSSKCRSLQPVLHWNDPNATAASRYEVGIWETQRTASGFHRDKRVYYRENVPGPKHSVETPLTPKTLYSWSVRTRGSTNWSSVAIYQHFDIDVMNDLCNYFTFTTPAK
jgi:hypothetical protein